MTLSVVLGLYFENINATSFTSIILLDVSPGRVALELQLPLSELELAFGHGISQYPETLANLNLGAGPMALSILGFNVGIEIMQLFVVVLIVPWLILLSCTNIYNWIRMPGALPPLHQLHG